MKFIAKIALGFMLPIAAENSAESSVVNVYSFREAKLINPIIERFSASTGIKVNVVSGKADKLLKRLIQDGENSFADVLLTSNVVRLEKAKQLGLLQAIESDYLKQHISPELRDPEGFWYGLSIRARAIFYAKDKVNASDIHRYEDLTSEAWHNKICTRKGSHTYNRSMLASFIALHGEKWAGQWTKGLVNNLAMRPTGGDRDQLRNVNRGKCDLAIANSYYFGTMSQSASLQDRQVYANLGVIWPEQLGSGTHVNISGAAITNAAKNKENAQLFIEFLLTEQAQTMYSNINHELPIRQDIQASELVRSWGDFKADIDSVAKLYQHLDAADRIIDSTGW
ncbi:extracellular solute-binding protein [Thalassotalea euphylliae]|uniref:Extracellular solute-binding protein n=1 Tax=Thalassotalea euphylliae TaxID=1655234 RepID=A0A3E0U1Q2_9GAMM|nr:extracellular solute-binding protein [Thalassotalea euphylliae]REL30630.1 extracellular solute-binding protein [Thalassotalea euphylliae]